MYKKIKIEDINIYQFPENSNSIGTNVTFIEDIKTQIVIDPGYRHLTEEIIEFIREEPICICTHYHPDHYDGARLFNNVLVANSDYSKSLKHFEVESIEITPNILIQKEQSMKFGDKEFTFIPNKGHSIDGMLIIYNNIIFVGDELMFTNEGKAILPFVASTVQNHIDSLIKIKELSKDKIVVPAHGKIIIDRDFLLKDINRRLKYLDDLKAKKVNISDEFYNYFLNLKWHDMNINAE